MKKCLLIFLLLPLGTAAQPYTVEDCVRIALEKSAALEEVDADIQGFVAQLAEVEAVYYPKLATLGFVAPMFGVKGSALTKEVDYDFSLGAWGPYTHIESMLALPLYTFGRVEAGKKAASQRIEVEKARRRLVQAEIALEVRKLYYTHLYALSMIPALKSANKLVTSALEQAQKMYDEGEGDMTQAELMRLTYGLNEVTRFQRIAQDGSELALQALRHTMGLLPTVQVELIEKRLPKPPLDEPEDLAFLLKRAAQQRPEWAQVAAGEKASLSLEDAERLAMAPVVVLAGTLSYDWAPTREDSANPYHYDPYNQVSGGAALALTWEFDPMKAKAKVKGAKALQAKVKALKRFASSGIPLQVTKADQEVRRNKDLTKIAKKNVTATRKWLAFSGAAYKTGTGDAKDVLEGLVANLQAKQTYYEHIRDYHISVAQLRFATGDDTPKKK